MEMFFFIPPKNEKTPKKIAFFFLKGFTAVFYRNYAFFYINIKMRLIFIINTLTKHVFNVFKV